MFRPFLSFLLVPSGPRSFVSFVFFLCLLLCGAVGPIVSFGLTPCDRSFRAFLLDPSKLEGVLNAINQALNLQGEEALAKLHKRFPAGMETFRCWYSYLPSESMSCMKGEKRGWNFRCWVLPSFTFSLLSLFSRREKGREGRGRERRSRERKELLDRKDKEHAAQLLPVVGNE